MENLKTLVYNKTKIQLKFKADLKAIVVGPGQTKTIQFGNLLKDETQQIRVLSGDGGEQVLVVLNRHDFPSEKTKELLVFQMLNHRLQYTFLHWTWNKYFHTKLEVLLLHQRRTEKLKTRIDNKTELHLKFRDVYRTGGPQATPYYGSKVIEVGPRGRTTIPSGTFLEAHRSRKDKCTQEIYVLSGDILVLYMSSDDFQNNQGKDLILDSQDNRFGFAFLQPHPPRWKNLLCFSKTHKSHDMEIFA